MSRGWEARSRDVAVVVAFALAALGVWRLRIIAPAHVAFDFLANADFYTQIYPMSPPRALDAEHGNGHFAITRDGTYETGPASPSQGAGPARQRPSEGL